jgi:hypothetical protein
LCCSGAQCKGKTDYENKSLTLKEVREIVQGAYNCEPPVTQFIIMSSGPKDARCEQLAREITVKNNKSGLFSVSIWGWEDILDRLADFPDLLQKYCAEFGVTIERHIVFRTDEESFEKYNSTEVSKRAAVALVGLSLFLVSMLPLILAARHSTILIGPTAVWLSVATGAAIVFLYGRFLLVAIFSGVEEDFVLGLGKMAKRDSSGNYILFNKSAPCDHPECEGKVILVPAPPSEQPGRKFVGRCVKGEEDHTYRVDPNFVGYPERFDWRSRE